MVEPTHLKNMIVKWKIISPIFGMKKKISNQNCQFQISNIQKKIKNATRFPGTFFPPNYRGADGIIGP